MTSLLELTRLRCRLRQRPARSLISVRKIIGPFSPGEVQAQVSRIKSTFIISSFRFAPSEVAEIVGKSDDGILDGKVKIKFKDGRLLNGYFKEGILHGFAR